MRAVSLGVTGEKMAQTIWMHKQKQIERSGWWFLKYVLFSPRMFGVSWSNLTDRIFFKRVGNSTTNQKVDFFYGETLRLWINTPNWNTPRKNPLPTGDFSRDSFHSWRTGDCLGCALGVCCNFLGERFNWGGGWWESKMGFWGCPNLRHPKCETFYISRPYREVDMFVTSIHCHCVFIGWLR